MSHLSIKPLSLARWLPKPPQLASSPRRAGIGEDKPRRAPLRRRPAASAKNQKRIIAASEISRSRQKSRIDGRAPPCGMHRRCQQRAPSANRPMLRRRRRSASAIADENHRENGPARRKRKPSEREAAAASQLTYQPRRGDRERQSLTRAADARPQPGRWRRRRANIERIKRWHLNSKCLAL